jgi:ribosomal protein S11
MKSHITKRLELRNRADLNDPKSTQNKQFHRAALGEKLPMARKDAPNASLRPATAYGNRIYNTTSAYYKQTNNEHSADAKLQAFAGSRRTGPYRPAKAGAAKLPAKAGVIPLVACAPALVAREQSDRSGHRENSVVGEHLALNTASAPYRTKFRKVRKIYRRFERVAQKPTSDEFCLVCVKKTKNNTHCSISRLFGDQKTLWTMSGGQAPGAAGSKSNGRRKSRYCQRMIFKAAVEKLFGLGFKYLVIHCVGRAISKRYVFRNFYRRFRIVLLKDLLAVPHNGCRPKSVRRL